MKRLIEYYDSIGLGDTGIFSTCSTKYTLLGLFPDTAGEAELKAYAKANSIKTVGKCFTPKDQRFPRREVHISTAIKLVKEHADTRWGKTEMKPVFLGLVDLNTGGFLEPVATPGTALTSEQVNRIIDNQYYGVSSVGETVNKEIVLVKQGWEYYHQLPLLGYSLESFESIAGITEHGFEDDTHSCHECGLYDSDDDGYSGNFRVVQECTLLGVNCGCFEAFCSSDEALEDYANSPDKGMELSTCEEFAEKGRLKFVERFIGGMTDGRGAYYGGEACNEGTPKEVLKALTAKHPKRRYIFSHDESGQFQTYFSVWQIMPKPRAARVVKATKKSDAQRIAIHLLKPTKREIEQARETAERDGFKVIYVHTKRTWPQAKGKK